MENTPYDSCEPSGLNDFDKRYKYTKKCKQCEKTHTLLTQEDADPEYYTEISVLCDCGNYVCFCVPVN